MCRVCWKIFLTLVLIGALVAAARGQLSPAGGAYTSSLSDPQKSVMDGVAGQTETVKGAVTGLKQANEAVRQIQEILAELRAERAAREEDEEAWKGQDRDRPVAQRKDAQEMERYFEQERKNLQAKARAMETEAQDTKPASPDNNAVTGRALRRTLRKPGTRATGSRLRARLRYPSLGRSGSTTPAGARAANNPNLSGGPPPSTGGLADLGGPPPSPPPNPLLDVGDRAGRLRKTRRARLQAFQRKTPSPARRPDRSRLRKRPPSKRGPAIRSRSRTLPVRGANRRGSEPAPRKRSFPRPAKK